MNYFYVGKIINTHGIKGELKIESESDFDRFAVGSIVYIEKNKNKGQYVVASHRVHKGYDLVSFVGYEDINLVLDLKGCMVYVDENSHSPLPEDEYYFEELIGKKVFNEEKEFIGIVSDVLDYPQGEILEIKREGKKNGLVPFRKEFIVDVNEDIIIHEIEGLL